MAHEQINTVDLVRLAVLPTALSLSYPQTRLMLKYSIDVVFNSGNKADPYQSFAVIPMAIKDAKHFVHIGGINHVQKIPHFSAEINIPAVKLIGEPAQQKTSGDYIYHTDSKNKHPKSRPRQPFEGIENQPYTTVGLLADCVTDDELPGSDVDFAHLLDDVVPRIFSESDSYSANGSHMWRDFSSDYPGRLALLANLQETLSQISGHNKATGAIWVREQDKFTVNHWGDVRVAILTRIKYPPSPLKVLYESPKTIIDKIDQLTITLRTLIADTSLPTEIRQEAETMLSEYLVHSYGMRFNNSLPGSLGAIGYIGDKSLLDFVSEKTIDIIPDYDYLFLAWSDGFESLSKIVGCSSIELALVIQSLINLNQPDVVNLLARYGVGSMKRGEIPPSIEKRRKLDDITLYIEDLNGAKAFWDLEYATKSTDESKLLDELLLNPFYREFAVRILNLLHKL